MSIYRSQAVAQRKHWPQVYFYCERKDNTWDNCEHYHTGRSRLAGQHLGNDQTSFEDQVACLPAASVLRTRHGPHARKGLLEVRNPEEEVPTRCSFDTCDSTPGVL